MTGVLEDRQRYLAPDQVMRQAWIPIRQCVRGSDHLLADGDVEKKFQALLQNGGRQPTPAPIGHWDGDWFVIEDGNHTYAALIRLGVRQMLVSWVDG